jgi:hypothetical protein
MDTQTFPQNPSHAKHGALIIFVRAVPDLSLPKENGS